jgi:putative oxidoreductase
LHLFTYPAASVRLKLRRRVGHLTGNSQLHTEETMNRIGTLLAHGYALVVRIGAALGWLPPTVARLAVGWVFFQSGWGKLHDLQKVTDYFTQLGLPAPAFQAGLTSTTEFVCGSLLLLGLGTRLAAAPLIITMIVAIRTALWDQVDSFGALFGLAEFLYIALLLGLATSGGGPLSVDWLLEHRAERRAPVELLSSSASRARA